MEKVGFKVGIISPESREIKGWVYGNWSNFYKVDRALSEVKAKEYNALILPGGVINPDQLRRNEDALVFVRDFFRQEKRVAALCHAPQILISTDAANGRKLTSFSSIKEELVNAGTNWVDEEAVVDAGFVTSRNPNDLLAFDPKLIEEIKKKVSMRSNMHNQQKRPNLKRSSKK